MGTRFHAAQTCHFDAENYLIVGVPTETKRGEQRVAIAPEGVYELVATGHTVLVESDAGAGSAFDDALYRRAGARVVDKAEEVFTESDIVVKVKEPLEKEVELMRPPQILMTFLHIAAYPEIGDALLRSGITAIGYETVALPDGRLPLLAPMSEIAGRIATQVGAHYLERSAGGRGVLMGGIPGVAPAKVTVIGAGTSGENAARVASGMGAGVMVLDIDLDKLRHIELLGMRGVTTRMSNKAAVHELVGNADLVVGAVLNAGHAAPKVVSEEMVRGMRPGSVIVDLSIDQGGCVETSHETSHDDPVYSFANVLHYAVGNIPAAVPHTSTQALTNATLPYMVRLADHGLVEALAYVPELRAGVQFYNHEVTCEGVAEVLGRSAISLD